MKKEDLMKIEGMTEALAEKVAAASSEELKGYIPKSRFDEVNEAKKNAEALIKERDTQLEALKKSGEGTEALKKQIEDLQEANKTTKEKYEADIHKMAVDNAVALALKDAGAKNSKAALALLTDLDKAVLNEDGTVKGLAKQIEALKQSDSYLFETGTPAGAGASSTPAGMSPAGGAGTGSGTPGKLTATDFRKMSYQQRCELYNTDRATYEALAKETT